jgi:predicted DNA-binding transcriptional regulator YafY
VQTFGFKDYTRSKQTIAVMTRAVFNKYRVRLTYQSPHDSKPTERELDPYRLWYVNNALYVVGHDHLRNDLRVFAVDRIRSVSLTNRRFEIPEDFDFEAFTRSAFNMIWGETQEVKIRFSASQAPYIRERTWHPSQKIETEPDGSIILTLQVADLWEVKFWLIGFGAEATVLGPIELAQEVGVEAETLAKVYRGFATETHGKPGKECE